MLSVGAFFWEINVGYRFGVYLPRDSYISSGQKRGALQLSLLVFFSYVITLSTLVPISLYVTMEFVRLLQSKWIDWDIDMFDEEKNIAAQVRTTTLNEELGQIEYIFSDKTGTLTQVKSSHRRIRPRLNVGSLLQNVMTFKKCSIRGQLFGYVFDEHGNDISDVNERPNEKRSSNVTEGGEDFPWPDEKLIEALKSDNEDVNRFFTLLSLCHTVMPEERNGQLFYQAQSPDENALVSAAQAFGYAFQVNGRPAPFSPIPFLSRIELPIRSPLLDETMSRSISIC